MAKAIGLRIYRLSVSEKGNPENKISFDSDVLSVPFYKFVDDFIAQNTHAKSVETLERTWFFERDKRSKELELFGQVNYGTYGFESNLKNNRTKKLNYRRKSNDVEEIPLYFHFSFPSGSNYAFAVFQSFQGRSCVQIVLDSLKERFEDLHPGLLFRFSKVMPHNAAGSIYNKAPVKRLRLIKKNTPSDLADWHHSKAPASVDVEVSISARRKQSLGTFSAVAGALRHDGVLVYQGQEFEKAVADIRVGGKTRPVGMFGDHTNAGVIDITENIIWGDTGHPTVESVHKEATQILVDFQSIMRRM